jgi:hypothetical protein
MLIQRSTESPPSAAPWTQARTPLPPPRASSAAPWPRARTPAPAAYTHASLSSPAPPPHASLGRAIDPSPYAGARAYLGRAMDPSPYAGRPVPLPRPTTAPRRGRLLPLPRAGEPRPISHISRGGSSERRFVKMAADPDGMSGEHTRAFARSLGRH